MPYIEGIVERVFFHEPTYVVLRLHVHRSEGGACPSFATAAGAIYGLGQLPPGVSVGLRGSWITHPKYGVQLRIEGWEPYAPSTALASSFLQRCLSWVISDTVANKVAMAFTDPFVALSERPEEVLALAEPGTNEDETLRRLIRGWAEARAQRDLASYLIDLRLRPEVIRGIYAVFGSEALAVVKENPYRLVAVPGFPFAQADTLGLQLGVDRGDPRRLEGALLHTLHEAATQGHLCLPRPTIPLALENLVLSETIDPFGETLAEDVQQVLDKMTASGVVKHDPVSGIYLPRYWRFERDSARILALFIQAEKVVADVSVEEFLESYQQQNRLQLSEAQQDGVRKLIEGRVLVLTGLPGTGKTTLVRALCALFKRLGVPVSLMAPTGIAAKRLAGLTGHAAATIHRTLGYDGSAWVYDAHNKFSARAVIVDEMSMVDMELFHRLLDALTPGAFLVLVGDDAQLPSVGPGNVLRELMDCEGIPHVRLTQIFRQAESSAIVRASHQIHRGALLDLNQPAASDFQFVPAREDVIADLIVEMALRLKARDANFQVLSPKYDGTTGVTNLNERLREALNPDRNQPSWKAGGLHMRVGDRIMVIKNDYELSLYNGDMGKLVDVTAKNLKVRIHGAKGGMDTVVDIPRDEAPEKLRLAYAITVHKSQGSEFDTVIFPVVRAHGRMLQRNLLYTAITRARHKVWVLGEPGALQKAVENDRVFYRYTGFCWALTRALAGVVDPV